MARIGISARLAKLEKRRRKQSPNRVLYYNPVACPDDLASADLPVWQVGYWRKSENPASGPLRAFVGRFLLVPDHGTAADWEIAAKKQQCKLLPLARSRSNEAEAPDIVGTLPCVMASILSRDC